MRCALVVGIGLMVVGCTDRFPIATVGETGSSGSAEPSSGDVQPTDVQPTGEIMNTSSEGGTASSGEAGSSGGSAGSSSGGTEGSSSGGPGSSSSESSGDESTGGEVLCGPPCDDPWDFFGDLEISSPENTDEFVCLQFVFGNLRISGDADAAALAGLRNLRGATTIEVEFNDALTDLSPFACLDDVSGGLWFSNMPALTDASALAGLGYAPYLMFKGTGLTGLPTFAPDYEGVTSVSLRQNPALTDLTAMATWGVDDWDFSLTVAIDDNPLLADMSGLDDLIAAAGDGSVSVQITRAPALTTLDALATMTQGTLWLQDLPQIADLGPLAGLTTGGTITLFQIPKVKTLDGLHNLEVANHLMIGDCTNFMGGTPGMDGLLDLSGLDALNTLNELSLSSNANIAALTGAPLLKTVYGLDFIENPKLTQAAVDAFVAQLENMPQACLGGWDECTCFEIMPW